MWALSLGEVCPLARNQPDDLAAENAKSNSCKQICIFNGISQSEDSKKTVDWKIALFNC